MTQLNFIRKCDQTCQEKVGLSLTAFLSIICLATLALLAYRLLG